MCHLLNFNVLPNFCFFKSKAYYKKYILYRTTGALRLVTKAFYTVKSLYYILRYTGNRTENNLFPKTTGEASHKNIFFYSSYISYIYSFVNLNFFEKY